MTTATAFAPSSAALVVFTPSGRRGQFALGTPILQAARSLGVDIDSVCGGRALCGRCQVQVMEGHFAKHGIQSGADHVAAVTGVEQGYSGLVDGRRLACQAKIAGDLVVDVPADSQVQRQVVCKSAQAHEIVLHPAVSLHYIAVQEPDMHDPCGDLRRVLDALEFDWGLSGLQTDLWVLQQLQSALRTGQWQVTVAVHRSPSPQAAQIVAVWPGLKLRVYGMAVDIGSTTIAAHICDLHSGQVLASSGMMNPQIRFGEDVMSRVSWVMMNPSGAAQMTLAVREALNELARSAAADGNIDPTDIVETSIVGNPVMHHLLLGLNPIELGGAPFALATDQALQLRAGDLGLTALHPGARAYILPCIAGHVGADTAGVILAERPDQSEAITLLVDVGTNAEIVLGNRNRLLACSSPTGPAFEGAQISSGQRASPGAIERVRIDPVTLQARIKVIGCEQWSDEPGFAQSLPEMGVTGICGSGIIEVLAHMYLSGILLHDGTIDGRLGAEHACIRAQGRTFAYELYPAQPQRGAILVTQNDVRAIQLAKAALYAGVRLLMERLQVPKVDRIRLAGAFGSHIDVQYAMVLGMIPDCDLAQVQSVGNAAGTGARIALLNVQAREAIEHIVRRVEKIETAVEPRFQPLFVAAMALPNLVDAFPELEKVLTLPTRKTPPADAGGRRPSRRAARSS